MSATSKDKENCSKEWHQCFPSFFHRLAFLIIVRIEANAERPRQIHWAIGGTSGTIENIKKVKLVADPKRGDCPEVFITLKDIPTQKAVRLEYWKVGSLKIERMSVDQVVM